MAELKHQARTSAVDGGQHQSVARTDLVLSVLAAHPEHGLRLMDVCRATGLGKTAAHRLLNGLVAYRLADYDERSSRYFVGFKIFAWASGAGNRFGLSRMAAPSLARLADTFGDAVYLLVRRGDDAVCVDRVEGAFPIKTLALKVGDHRPLGIGAGALAMLACLPDADVERIVGSGAAARAPYGLSDGELLTLVKKTRAQGFALVDGTIIRGIATVSAPLLLNDGSPVAAISVSTIQERLRPPRRRKIAAAIRREIDAISDEFRLLLIAKNAKALTHPAIA
jgi:DNA-binding IclR family transcriptional regulator